MPCVLIPGTPPGPEVRTRRKRSEAARPPRIPPVVEDAETKPPGDRRAVPDGADPRPVVPAAAIDDHEVAGHIGPDVARRISLIDHLRRRVVDAYVSDVMQRRAARDRIDDRRYVSRHRPRSVGTAGREPHAVVQRVKGILTHPDYRYRRIDRGLQRSAGDGLERG